VSVRKGQGGRTIRCRGGAFKKRIRRKFERKRRPSLRAKRAARGQVAVRRRGYSRRACQLSLGRPRRPPPGTGAEPVDPVGRVLYSLFIVRGQGIAISVGACFIQTFAGPSFLTASTTLFTTCTNLVDSADDIHEKWSLPGSRPEYSSRLFNNANLRRA
jgi:hypothetical protein